MVRGFVGSHVVDGLLENGHDVLVVDDLSTGTRSNLPADAEFIDLDVSDDGIVSVVKSFGPDVISHLAAQSSVPVSMSDPILDARVNILGGLNVIRGAIEADCEQVVYINTGGALYGEPEYLPCDEDHPIKPISAYGLSKWTSECYFRDDAAGLDSSEGAAARQHLWAETGPARGVGSHRDLHPKDAARRSSYDQRGRRAYEGLCVRRRTLSRHTKRR